MEQISGLIEGIIYKNEDNGYVVAKLDNAKDSITVVGYVPYINEGQNLKLTGEWVKHPQFGTQFKIASCEEVRPTTLNGIEKYLSSGIIMGIGPVTAKKIVDKFGEDTLKVLDEDIQRLREIEGIGNKKIEIIKDSYKKQREVQNIMIFLQTYGVTPNQCMKIYKRFGSRSIEIVKQNPYILTDEISGIGFKTADKIARNLGVEPDSPFRIQSGIRYVINEFCAEGNTYMPLTKLVEESVKILNVEKVKINEGIYNTAADSKIILENINGENAAFSLPYYYCELGITKNLLSIALIKYEDININIEEEIKIFENENHVSFAPSQKEAIKGALENGVEVITGGPGTGKTTIIKCITHIFEKCGMRVVMGAPTGRAAKRMSESTGREAKTIHRLLEMGVTDEEMSVFSKDEDSPLDCDVVIIDEASMIDVVLMNNLLKAIKSGTRLVIVGDVDQLPSVGPGNVLKDIINSGCAPVVPLKEIFRQSKESLITINAHKINQGEMPILNGRERDFYFINEENPSMILKTLLELVDKRLPKFNNRWDKLKHIQVLSPMKKGNLGVVNLNLRLQELLNTYKENKPEKSYKDYVFRVGDKVMQVKNNYTLKWVRICGNGENEGVGVFNGDMGVIEYIDEDQGSVSVVFDEERRVIYDNISLDELELAYAITIHKSQGSEFPVIIIPAFMGSPFLMNRNLLYTAITRAKEFVVIVGSIKALKFMVENNRSFERFSSLEWRISSVLNSGMISRD
ncbi:ATP-dependent RecD-like DNA helicase [Clostridium polynesiense]|uniref:SF1B family DNA helicase RecD2 n=1 Tax=Clostridium polynesiense TaxID=1325933 RepID=UPI0005910FA3|nr:ATP-dependent RecD-like DNA helicase [Clostridium polynesiense]